MDTNITIDLDSLKNYIIMREKELAALVAEALGAGGSPDMGTIDRISKEVQNGRMLWRSAANSKIEKLKADIAAIEKEIRWLEQEI